MTCLIEEEKGELLISRRLGHELDVRKFGPFPNLEWINHNSLPRHQQYCSASQSTSQTTGSLVTQSDVIAHRIHETASTALRKDVFSIMLIDEVSIVAKNDSLIVALGNNWLARNVGNKLMRRYYTSSVMRLVAKLLINLRLLKPLEESDSLSSYITGQNFDIVVKAALICATRNFNDAEELEKPSNAFKNC